MVNFERWNFFTGEIGGENIGEGIGKFLIFKRKKKNGSKFVKNARVKNCF